MSTSLKPGEKAPKSGQYEVVGPRGGNTGTEVTGVKGKTLPPTPKPGMGYQLVDPTKHKGWRRLVGARPSGRAPSLSNDRI
jgi:hypothetical protein